MNKRITAGRMICIVLFVCCATRTASGDDNWTIPDPLSQIDQVAIQSTIEDGFTLAAGGDLIYGRPQSPLMDPEFEQVADILRSADIAFANLEMSILDMATFDGYPAAENGGGNPVGDASVARDLQQMGLDMVSRANNHAVDWGISGMAETSRLLDRAGIVYAGSGRNRAVARSPAYIETPYGRVALVATASTFPPSARAGLAVGESPGRPGISVLRTRRTVLVNSEEMSVLRDVAARHGARITEGPDRVRLFGQAYRQSGSPGLTYAMNPYDHFEILKAIRGAKQTSDLTVFSIHAHETASGAMTDPAPADFLPALFHNAVDAGADIIFSHGQHALRGIEIYKGKPIFYGLASLFFQLDLYHAANRDVLESLDVDPRHATYVDYHRKRFSELPPAWYESIVAVTTFEGGLAKEIRLYPIDLNHAVVPKHRGFPTIASTDMGTAILQRVRKYSAQFGTNIDIENNVGVIRIR